MIRAVINSVTLTGINHLLAQHAWARRRLAAHAESVVAIEAVGVTLRCAITNDGYLSDASRDRTADATIDVSSDAVSALGGGIEDLMHRVKIQGNADIADTLGFVFRHLTWDREADLARLLGPILGRRLNLAVERGARTIPQAGTRLARNAGEYLVHEGRMLVAHGELQTLQEALRHLRDDIARLDKRIARLRAPLP